LRPNPLKPRLAAGGCAFGTMTFEFFTPGYPQICREAGAEFILYDMEHSGVGFETMKAQFAFCRGLDLVPLVRVPSGDYHHVARALDIGAMGIMVPMVETAAQALEIVSATRYPPAGRRGAAFNVAGHDDYSGGSEVGKIAAANARTMVALVETTAGLAAVDEIAAVDGIDMLLIGSNDLCTELGIPGELRHPKLMDAFRRTADACRSHGKVLGIGGVRGDLELQAELFNLGGRFIIAGSDVTYLTSAASADAKRLRDKLTT